MAMATPFVTNIAAYQFVTIEDPEQVASHARALAEQAELKGTILVASEGINLFLAGKHDGIESFLIHLRRDSRFADLTAKYSYSPTVPFGKLAVKLKREIVPLGDANLPVDQRSAPRIDGETLKRWIDEGRDFVLLDTRNRFEFEQGTFDGAVELGLTEFRSFPSAVAARLDEWQDLTIVTFCTGGIRCEKAAPLMTQMGFKNVHQLDGGILKYFETVGGKHYRGTCFVFDDRRGVDSDLVPQNLAE
jgi:UPF0176 protein